MMSRHGRNKSKSGVGLFNTLLNKLPIELHLKGYNYCGPGTRLKERLARGDVGVNKLDELCKYHDIFYDKHHSTAERHKADEVLEHGAWDIVKSKDSGFKERAAAYLVTNAMKAKRKIGMGCGFKTIVSEAKKAIKKHKKTAGKDITKLIKIALTAARKKTRRGSISPTPRVIPVPKSGGALPLIPIFAALSALGSLTGGAGSIIRSIMDAREASDKKSTVKLGKGLYLKPYKNGAGLFLSPPKTKN
ncbi:uncharacterized protein LOC126909002 [Daktulosphaira vitifoliae]|uniref:uncharacterized protein LOC126909002 n=1 Tax=Daktulosphaira vitifoliae TaxID=58002 RepID=UPI0021AA62B0|nr:uncharacterized protein LOC126909002 [Daktulosphaira vitifoliae]